MIDIGSRRELFIDDYLIDKEKTTAQQVLCRPEKRESVFSFDAPYESYSVGYFNICQRPDGKYFMYYITYCTATAPGGGSGLSRHVCVLESDDGLHWTRPELTIAPFEGSPVNNCLIDEWNCYDNMFVFYDTNPACPENERYKAIHGEWLLCLWGYTSPDEYHFTFHGPHEETILMTQEESSCGFDSLNTMYFDEKKGKYIAFIRGTHDKDGNDVAVSRTGPEIPGLIRDVRYSESEDFHHWTYPVRIKYEDDFDYELYTNGVIPYYRAPHIFVAMPTRYTERLEWNDSFEKLCGVEDRRTRPRGMCMTDSFIMTSRDALNWKRYSEAFLTAGPEQPKNWIYGDCYACIGYIETPSEVEGADPTLSFFCSEDQEGKPSQLYRYEMRIDGFVALRSTYIPQQLVTKPFVYDGKELEINFETSPAGYIKFTLRCEDGREIHSGEVFGNKIDRIVGFEDGSPADFAGKSVTLTAEMSDASIYSFRFK